MAQAKEIRALAAQHALRRRRIIRIILSAIATGILLLCVLDHLGAFHRISGYAGNDHAAFDTGAFVVRQVHDDNTLDIAPAHGSAVTRVCLLGIAAPDVGERVDDYLRNVALGKTVIVRLEPSRTRDSQGRLLAYVFLSDSDNLNLNLIRHGRARTDAHSRHSLESQFRQAESEARRKRLGLWADVPGDQMPAGRGG